MYAIRVIIPILFSTDKAQTLQSTSRSDCHGCCLVLLWFSADADRPSEQLGKRVKSSASEMPRAFIFAHPEWL